ncbi:aspartate cytoplasmic [Micractinium conductrix]|uniref:Aspartate aminotransferase n=1 Tax=Micractinium conductrix TaxID=554055 RepID=A0A2P6VEG0_9CHLO|nr:aspartate cytoplasmic [Micractinium conductrix]|eukprot:PSC72490.1 aspartate cytoplasmic [Micractinium conductrix]
MSVFSDVPKAPPDAILSASEGFEASTNPNKLNLGVGAYRTEEGKPLVLGVVKEAKRRILADASQDHEYLIMGGIPEFCKLSALLAFGADSKALQEGRAATIQCLSGTGSLRVGGEFLARFYSHKLVLTPTPSWANHKNIFERCGLQTQGYRYYLPATRGLDYEGLIADLQAAPEGAVVILHACAHNPTGVDPTPEQWRGILQAVQSRRLLPFFDSAYQGFASGDLERDAASIRMFADAGLEMLLAQSYAKNMGLYGERVGALTVISSDAAAKKVESQLMATARAMYSNPPKFGALLVTIILSDPELLAQWKVELKGMADRIHTMRRMLFDALQEVGAPGSWNHVLEQIGMFSYTGLTEAQVENMTTKWSVFMTRDGRISMAGLSGTKCKYLAEAIKDSVENC